MTIGEKLPGVVGEDVTDKNGNLHTGIIQFPIPVLKGNIELLKTIRTKLFDPAFEDLTVVDFSDLAQKCKTYNEFIVNMSFAEETRLNYMGIAVCGNKKKINKLTGNLQLLR